MHYFCSFGKAICIYGCRKNRPVGSNWFDFFHFEISYSLAKAAEQTVAPVHMQRLGKLPPDRV